MDPRRYTVHGATIRTILPIQGQDYEMDTTDRGVLANMAGITIVLPPLAQPFLGENCYIGNISQGDITARACDGESIWTTDGPVQSITVPAGSSRSFIRETDSFEWAYTGGVPQLDASMIQDLINAAVDEKVSNQTVVAVKGDPGSAGSRGEAGKSAYDVAVQAGFSGDVFAWLMSLIGAQGATGQTGAVGATGIQGEQGATGATGSKGDQGSPGATGAKGDTGNQGSTGATGAQGPKGDTGAAGVAGTQGVAGQNGGIGATGATGAQGAKGDTGAVGATGAQGAKGDVGNTGAQGATGSIGATGSTGAQGPIGLTGATGATGSTGAAGSNATATPLGSATPQALGTAAAGASTNAAREDHVHAKPSGLLQLVGTGTAGETLLASLSLGVKRISVTVAGVATTDKLLAILNGAPTAGCELFNVYPTAANTVSVGLLVPTLVIGATYSVPFALYRIL